MNKDLTVGRPEGILWRFCLPLFASVIFQQLYNLADSLIAGKFISENALAAVGNSYEITLIFLAFGVGCNMGCSVVVSQFFGAKKYNDMKCAISTTIIGTAILCGGLMLFGFLGCDWLLEIIRTPAETMVDSKTYLQIYVCGLPFLFFYNIANGIFSALGDSRTPFIFLACSSTANIGLDLLFVIAFHWGVAGLAWATFLCQGISCVLAMGVVLKRLKGVKTIGRVPWFSFRIFKHITSIAVPSILQQSAMSVSTIIIQGVINGFGPAVMAGYAVSVKLNNMVITAFTTLGNGISNYTAQNLGANKLGRIKQGFRAGSKLVLAISFPLFLLYFFMGEPLIMLFLKDPTPLAVETAIRILKIFSPFYLIVSVKLVADGILRGSGMMGKFMFDTIFDGIIRVGLAVYLPTKFGVHGIWWAWPIGWVLATILAVSFYHGGVWKNVPVTEDASRPCAAIEDRPDERLE